MLLQASAQGDASARNSLFTLVYDEIRRIAAGRIRKQRPDGQLRATELVNEAYLRLFGREELSGWASRKHFYCTVALVMRNIVIEQTRRNAALKHGNGAAPLPLPPSLAGQSPDPAGMLMIEQALSRLETARPAAAEVFMLEHFAGRTHEEAAEMLEIPLSAVRRHWQFAVGFMTQELSGDDPLKS